MAQHSLHELPSLEKIDWVIWANEDIDSTSLGTHLSFLLFLDLPLLQIPLQEVHKPYQRDNSVLIQNVESTINWFLNQQF